MKFSSILIIVVIFLMSCSTQDKTTQNVAKIFEKKGIVFDEKLTSCLILPEVGCSGCIAGGVSFFKDNKDHFSNNQEHNKIVFTSILSLKMLRLNIDVADMSSLNCIVDKENKYLIDGKDSIYPLVLFLEKGKIVKAMFQSPFTENIFTLYQSRLNNDIL